MDLKVLRILFDDGAISSAEAVRVPFGKGWYLTCKKNNGDIVHVGTTREPGKPKLFRSLDAVASASTEIGFSELLVHVKEQKKEGGSTEDFKLEVQ
ncbi:hypothetical protein [Pleionea litopenaei]|uniref:Uncharacterized protein n=1 Tax=Pleionea litopenaei TaxID=3070815 RepID=A0AA51RXB9_9GAMM|nr:hypothetical protein [Pleionea sp. HL-JVS1]WMS89295.1 hypothetical protein Q9312_19365 [Pleionea sp. HL-JVS1]WMS89316.1 hypothetical protein Q9312_19255 [Pleionea sp. HL-JVS1]